MLSIQWLGRPPGASVRADLLAAGLRLGAAEQATARVVWTPAATLPVAPGGHTPWLWLSGRAVGAELAREAVVRGAYDVIARTDPAWSKRLRARVSELAEREPPLPPTPEFIAASESSRQLLGQLARAARTSMPVLLTGETGTGKDLCARLIHQWSERRAARFVAINCAAIPNELIESELFGYVRGAFSGAVRDYDGQLTAASGGTVFLDEIDDTPPTLQSKLLRVLEDRVVSRLGENVWRELDFRILAASNRDLGRLIQVGSFGADLYERLAIVSIAVPPLRQRIDDLPALVDHMFARFYAEEPAARTRGEVAGIDPRALAAMAAYPWPGNVRELRNVVFEALVNKRSGTELLLADLPRRILRAEAGVVPGGSVCDGEAVARLIAAGQMNLRREVEALERQALGCALERAGGNASRAARLLGEVGRGSASDPGGTVRAMMRRLGLDR